jgi:NitT/TauT family transport system permease protein
VTAALRRASLGVAGTVGIAGAVQLALWADRINQAVFPLPSTMIMRAAGLAGNGAFLAAVGSTLVAWAEAMVITVAIAVPAGMLLGMLPRAESAVRPVIEFLRPIPSVVLLPLVLLIVQDDLRTEVVVIVFASVWPVIINTVYGFREVDPVAKETLRSFGFGSLAVACRVSLPSAAPFIATGVRIAASLAFVVAVAVELIGVGMSGIGAYVGVSQSGSADIAMLLAVAIWSGLIGLGLNAVFVAAERRAFRWHHALTETPGGTA